LATLALLATAGTASAAYTLDLPEYHTVEGTTWMVAVGDVTGDGRDDVVVLKRTDATSKVLVYQQKSDGSLTDPPRIYALPDSATLSMALGDLNQDGIQDVVVGGIDSITTLVSDKAAPIPLQAHIFATTVSTSRIELLKIDDDRFPDVVCVAAYSTSGAPPVAFLGDGRGGLRPVEVSVTSADDVLWQEAQAGDLDGNGTADLLATDNATMRLVYNNGRHSARGGMSHPFATPFAIDPGFLVEHAVVGDFNYDGRNDIVAVGAVTGPTFLYVYKQAVAGERFPQADSLASVNYLAFAGALAGDFDGDGRDDLLIAHRGNLGLYLQGDTGLGAEMLYSAAYDMTSLALGDVNGDGCKDLVVANYGDMSSTFYVRHGLGCTSPLPPPPPLPDLRVALVASPSSVTASLVNRAGSEIIEAPLAELDLSVNAGTLQTGTLPANCVLQSHTTRSQHIECLVDALSPGATASLAIPVSFTGTGARGALRARLHAITSTNEPVVTNNYASAMTGH
jgi:hypothetical protein